MAEKDDKSLIGFDPLAWMDDESEGNDNKVIAESSKEQQETAVEAKEGEDNKIVLEAILNIQNVSSLYEQLKKQLDNKETIEIDASAIEQIDTANLQLLGILKQTAVKLHKEVIFDFPSEKFIESAELLGLSEILEVDQAAAGLF